MSLYIVQFVCSNTVLSKFDYFERTLIRKNEINKKISKEQNWKEKNEFRKNVIRSNDLVPKFELVFLYFSGVHFLLFCGNKNGKNPSET